MTHTTLTGDVRRNTFLLSGLQALGGANPAVVVALGGLVGEALSRDPEIATLPVSLFNIGMAIGILPAAWIMRKLGRRGGYFIDRKSTRLNSSHVAISYAVFCL